MKHALFIVPIGQHVGLSAVCQGLVRALESRGLRASLLELISLSAKDACEKDPFLITKPLSAGCMESLLSDGKKDRILEFFIEYYMHHTKDKDVVVIPGVLPKRLLDYAPRFNCEIAKALDLEVIFVTMPGDKSLEVLSDQLEVAATPYGGVDHPKVLGGIFNKVGAPVDREGNARLDLFDQSLDIQKKDLQNCRVFSENFQLLGSIDWNRQLTAIRVKDIQKFLQAKVLAEGKMDSHRVMYVTIAAANVENAKKVLKPHTMIITSGDRSDIILAVCKAYVSGTQIALLLLSGGYTSDLEDDKVYKQAIEMGLTILSVKTDSLRTAIKMQSLHRDIFHQDAEREEKVKEFVASGINKNWIDHLSATCVQRNMSPPAFRFQLVEKAKKQLMTIVLPEGEELRILQAASIATQRKIAKIVLLGNRKNIEHMATENSVSLNNIDIVEPDDIKDQYVDAFVQLRQHKNVTIAQAKEQLKNSITLATMMVQANDADGLVAGAIHTTKDTITPAFQLIKTKPQVKLVSSIFFMCLPTQVLIYGDCAVNPSPSSEELADIAIQSAESAKKFSIEPKIAMISYSTGSSAKGTEVQKVQDAVGHIKRLSPDLIVDGPLQYDAAFVPEVAEKKAPNSRVAGQATVYIFPDLNTANTTYKAVQRSANVLSIGPILQGLNKPVNDLSRGSTVEDIVFTIAITAIQAQTI